MPVRSAAYWNLIVQLAHMVHQEQASPVSSQDNQVSWSAFVLYWTSLFDVNACNRLRPSCACAGSRRVGYCHFAHQVTALFRR